MNNNFILRKQAYLIIAVVALFFSSCKVEKLSPVAESAKNLTGTWKVIQATRNGTNLIPLYDFTQFSIKFDATAKTYTMVNPVPFIVAANGTYAFDDPQYPFTISFTATGGQPVKTAFNYPIIGGARQIIMTFSPGCTQNTYVFTLTKTN